MFPRVPLSGGLGPQQNCDHLICIVTRLHVVCTEVRDTRSIALQDGCTVIFHDTTAKLWSVSHIDVCRLAVATVSVVATCLPLYGRYIYDLIVVMGLNSLRCGWNGLAAMNCNNCS